MIPISRTENLNGLPSELAIYESILPDLEIIFMIAINQVLLNICMAECNSFFS
jgi:hypothetical protein